MVQTLSINLVTNPVIPVLPLVQDCNACVASQYSAVMCVTVVLHNSEEVHTNLKFLSGYTKFNTIVQIVNHNRNCSKL